MLQQCSLNLLPRTMFSFSTRFMSKGFVGPPDEISNLRRYRYELPENPTPLEQRLFSEREKVQEWNHAFWSRHNQDFMKLKEEFIAKGVKEKGGDATLNADEMSVFYKQFLDDNWKKHIVYNFTWYRKNVNVAFLHFKVKVASLFKR